MIRLLILQNKSRSLAYVARMILALIDLEEQVKHSPKSGLYF